MPAYRTVPAFLRSYEAAIRWLGNHGTSLDSINAAHGMVDADGAEFIKESPETTIGELMAVARDAYRWGRLPVFRAVEVGPGHAFDPLCLGIYWSFEKEHAKAHWGTARLPTIVIEGVVRPRHVDWESSLQAIARIPEEFEVTLHDDAPVLIENPYDDGEIRGMTGNHLSSSHWRRGCASSKEKTRAAWARW